VEFWVEGILEVQHSGADAQQRVIHAILDKYGQPEECEELSLTRLKKNLHNRTAGRTYLSLPVGLAQCKVLKNGLPTVAIQSTKAKYQRHSTIFIS